MHIHPQLLEIPLGYIVYFVPVGKSETASERLRKHTMRDMRISRFETKIVETDDTRLIGRVAARRINLGNYNTPAMIVLNGAYGDIDNFAFRQFADTLLDITAFDTQELIEINSVSRVINDGTRSCTQIVTELSAHIKNRLMSIDDDTDDNDTEWGIADVSYCDAMPYDGAIPEEESAPQEFYCMPSKHKKTVCHDKILSIEPKKCSKHTTPTTPAPAAPKENKAKKALTNIVSRVASLFPSEEEKIQKAQKQQLLEERSLELSQEIDKKICLDRITAVILEYVTRFHEMPPMEQLEEIIAGKIIIRDNGLSPITVNRDMKIILPDYNEMELRFTPLLQTIYILFLKHPEGIRLKEIADFKDELIDIYLLIKPGRKDRLMTKSITEICNPMGDSLRQKLSKIKRMISNTILNPAIADAYIIKGERGELYRIPAASTAGTTLPKALS